MTKAAGGFLWPSAQFRNTIFEYILRQCRSFTRSLSEVFK
jgi:hypothetical protein